MLGEALRLFRVFHDLRSMDLAEKLGISPGYLCEIEKGKKTPTMELIKKYAEVFETTPSAILFFSENLDIGEGKGKIKSGVRGKLIKFMQAVEKGGTEIH
jgi:transcriptional regulator with XRE-family HTH domain